MAGTGFAWNEQYAWVIQADNLLANPREACFEPLSSNEVPEAKRRIRNLLDVSGLLAQLKQVRPYHASEEALRRVHTEPYLKRLESSSAAGIGVLSGPIGPPMVAFQNTWDIARLAAGGTMAVTDAVATGAVDNGYALVRPPGHHSLADMAMGYCFLANVAIAARHAQAEHGLKRIAILDWDVHHGNGSQSIFWQDPTVLTISLHQEAAYPYETGGIEEIGANAGCGTNFNIPLLSGSGHGAYLSAMQRIVVPAIQRFKPDFIFVACGFDAGNGDNTGRMMLHSDSFREMTAVMMELATEQCGGRLVMSHEGGYNPATVPYFALAVMEQLSGFRTRVVDPFVKQTRAAPGQALRPFQSDHLNRIADHFSTHNMI